MREYKDYQGNEIVEGTTIIWQGIDWESEASAGVGNDGMWSWKHTLVAKAKGKRLVFEDVDTKHIYEWDSIDDKLVYENNIYVIQ